MNLSENLKQIRKDNNLSQEALAEMLGVSRQAVSKWESGTAYPEMDKVLQICKLFNVNLNDLMNEDIKIAREKKENKNTLNKFVDEVLEYITKSINMFSTLNFKSKIVCLFEQSCILIILAIIGSIIGSLLGSVLYKLFMYVPEQIYNFISALCGSIYGITIFILIAIIWLHIFKSRYLDYYKVINKDSTPKEDSGKELNNEIRKEPKIIIRDKGEEGTLFKTLFKICLIFVKMLAVFISFFFITGVITLGALLVYAFIFNLASLFFWGAIITLLSLIIVGLICLKFIYDFIFNRSTRKGLIGIILGISLLTTGIGIGLFTINILKMNYYDEIPTDEVVTDSFSIIINDKANYINIHPCDYNKDIKCEFIESNTNEISIEVEHSKYVEVDIYSSYNEYEEKFQWIDTYYYIKDEMIFKYLNKVIKDLNNNKIYDIKPNKITVYAPREVLDKILESE